MKTVVSAPSSITSEPNHEKIQETSKTSEAETVEQKESVKRYFLDDEMNEETAFEGNVTSHEMTQEEQQRRTQERLERIRNYTSHLNSAEGLSELEREPAFKRRKIDLDDHVRSSDDNRSEEHTSELQSRPHLVCRLLLEKKKKKQIK